MKGLVAFGIRPVLPWVRKAAAALLVLACFLFAAVTARAHEQILQVDASGLQGIMPSGVTVTASMSRPDLLYLRPGGGKFNGLPPSAYSPSSINLSSVLGGSMYSPTHLQAVNRTDIRRTRMPVFHWER